LAHFTLHPNLPAVQLNQRLGDAEPQAGAGLLADRRVVGAEKARKELRLILGRNAHPRITDLNQQLALLDARPHRRPPLLGILAGIRK